MTLINYVDYKHSYAHVLAPKLKTINYFANVAHKPPKYIRKIIINELNAPEVYFTEKEHWFYEMIQLIDDSRQLYMFVRNSINKAKETLVYVDQNGNLLDFVS